MGRTDMTQNEDDSEVEWTDYLEQRPDFRKWYELATKVAGHSNHGHFESPIEILRQCNDSVFHNERLVSMHDRIIRQDNTDDILDFDDGEALAYAVNMGPEESNRHLMHSAIRNIGRPSIGFDELKRIGMPSTYTGSDYFIIPCLKASQADSVESEEVLDATKRAESILKSMNGLSPVMNHVYWDTDEDYFRTVCEYGGKTNIFRSPCSDMVIDKDYLDHYLLTPKPSPGDVSEEDWHGMSLRLVKQFDKEVHEAEDYSATIFNRETDTNVRTAIRFKYFMSSALLDCFLDHSLKDLAFMETVYGLCAHLFPDDWYWYARTGAIGPEVFDMLREYGPSFVGPVFENALR